jgi:RNA polymerase sigma-70 factor, ECF subfamily
VTEEALMAAYGGGDARAFRQLFEGLAPRVHAFFLRSFRHAACADDLMQQTFLRLHKSRAAYKPGLPVRPWVFTMAASVRRDELRRRYRLPKLVDEDEWERAEASVAPEPLAAEPGDDVEAVRAALDRLPETQRVVIHLHRYEEMTFDQIAVVLGTTPGAVRVRASRAYTKLREELEAQLGKKGGTP